MFMGGSPFLITMRLTMEPAKPWYESKTIWANLLVTLAAILLLASEQLNLSPEATQWLLFLAGVANILLRTVTDQPITTKRD